MLKKTATNNKLEISEALKKGKALIKHSPSPAMVLGYQPISQTPKLVIMKKTNAEPKVYIKKLTADFLVLR